MRHQASLLNVSQLIKNSVLIESELNHKSKEKHAAARYHHFYLPIKVKDKLYTVHIVGEQLKDSIGYTPIDVKLYDVIVAKKRYILYSHPKRLKSKECTFYNYNIRNASECQRLPQSAVY
uniref:LPD3 domain-containing protein n=1 Tax=uncultured Allisonella sp. TaxID=339338 RepID=UPI00339006F0